MKINEHLVETILNRYNHTAQNMAGQHTKPAYMNGLATGYVHSAQIVMDLLNVSGKIVPLDPSNQLTGFRLVNFQTKSEEGDTDERTE